MRILIICAVAAGTSASAKIGISVSLVEKLDQVTPSLDPDMAVRGRYKNEHKNVNKYFGNLGMWRLRRTHASCNREKGAASARLNKGFRNVCNLSGGFKQYKAMHK